MQKPDTTKYQQLSLREAAEFDYRTGQREKLTGWGIISKARNKAGISRKARRAQKGQ